MKFQEFSYEVMAEVEMTHEEASALCELAGSHYDGTCKAAAKEGGFLYGWRNQTDLSYDPERVGEPSMVRMTIRQLNLCCKILEMFVHLKPTYPHYDTLKALDTELVATFRKVNDESGRCNVPGTYPALTPPEDLKPLLRQLDDLIGFREAGGTVGAAPILRDYEALSSQTKAWIRQD